MIAVPKGVPRVGIQVRDHRVVDFVYGGRCLHVEIAREDGATVGFVQLEADSEIDGAYSWRLVACYP